MKAGSNERRGADNQPSAGLQTIRDPATTEALREVDRLNLKLDEVNRKLVNLSAFLMNCERYRRPIRGNMQAQMVFMVPEQDLMPKITELRDSLYGGAGEPEIEGVAV